ncbi:MAG: SMI1/KNR4 family protein [Pseudomonadota bacterium]
MALDLLISEFNSYLRDQQLPVSDRLNLGLERSVVEDVFDSLGIDSPDDLINLYCYQNGTKTSEADLLEDIYVIPGYYWLSLNDVKEVYQAISPHPTWDLDWVPIFATGGGDFYAVICRRGADFGAVVQFTNGEPEQVVEFESLESFFRYIALCFKDGAFFVDDGFIEEDPDESVQVMKDLQNEKFQIHSVAQARY